jgi:hypothetical protein
MKKRFFFLFVRGIFIIIIAAAGKRTGFYRCLCIETSSKFILYIETKVFFSDDLKIVEYFPFIVINTSKEREYRQILFIMD